ncbi:hypothetical protein HY745_10050, partial [Candidatus Desantisbacteria bacterium]|nr:hypothetical protein [Candidatus Desantisbacteria bacterium]
FRAQKEVTSCSLCHGNDFQGGTSGLSCYLCHNGPNGKEHPVNWIHNHAAEVKVEISSCTHCHGDDYKGGINKISCYQCHLGGENGLPHQNEWNIDSTGVFTNHQTALYGRGYESCSLSYCHGEKLTGGELTISWGKAPSCSTLDYKEKNCHPEIPSL